MRTVITAESLIDGIPPHLPITCLRKVEDGHWRLKTATELGVHQTDYRGPDVLDVLEEAIKSYAAIPHQTVGPLVLCLEHEDYFGLEPRIIRALPDGHIKQGVREIIFPWSTQPK